MTSTNQDALLPCPHCGSEQVTTAPDREWGDVTWVAMCKACGAGVHRDLEADAIAAWNVRPTSGEAEPVAIIRFDRGTPGNENEMPKVISCNWLPDGEYRLYAAPPADHPAGVRELCEAVREYLACDGSSGLYHAGRLYEALPRLRAALDLVEVEK